MSSLQGARQPRHGVALIFALVLAAALAIRTQRARAQEIEPYDPVPLPPGSNALLGYYNYGDQGQFNFANGRTYTDNTGMQVNLGAVRYLHYFTLGSHPAAVQVMQIFGSASGGEIAGQSLGSTFGASDVALNMAIWPYADRSKQQYLAIVGWIYPPTGTYDPNSAINLGTNRWEGDVQVAWHQGVGRHFSYDLSFDSAFYGGNSDAFPGGLQLTQDPTYCTQVWLNWGWSPRLMTSVGYEGFFGGSQYLDGIANGQKTEEQRLRLSSSYFVTPTLQALLELNHDVQAVGGFKQDFGAILRFLWIF